MKGKKLNPKTLYIIGNGFDLHHGLPTRFSDFRDFVSKQNPDLERTVEEHLCDLRGNWANIEEALAHLDIEQLNGNARNYLYPYNMEDWSDSYHHSYQDEIDSVLSALSSDLKQSLSQWIEQIEIPTRPPSLDLTSTKNKVFLNFNYTSTLQNIYSIDRSKVVHLHGSVDEEGDDIIIGHGWKHDQRPKLNDQNDYRQSDVRVVEGNDLIEKYFDDTFKPTQDIIQRHQSFFSLVAKVSNIYVLGHSLSKVDLPYFREIVANTESARPDWHISYYSLSDKKRHSMVMNRMGIDASNLYQRRLA